MVGHGAAIIVAGVKQDRGAPGPVYGAVMTAPPYMKVMVGHASSRFAAGAGAASATAGGKAGRMNDRIVDGRRK